MRSTPFGVVREGYEVSEGHSDPKMYYNSVSGAVWVHQCVFYYYSLKRAYALRTHFCTYDTFWSKTFKKTEQGVVKYKGAQLKISNSAKNTREDLEVIITTSHLDFGRTRLCSSTFKCNNSCCSHGLCNMLLPWPFIQWGKLRPHSVTGCKSRHVGSQAQALGLFSVTPT